MYYFNDNDKSSVTPITKNLWNKQILLISWKYFIILIQLISKVFYEKSSSCKLQIWFQLVSS